jgi:hypothetical protein
MPPIDQATLLSGIPRIYVALPNRKIQNRFCVSKPEAMQEGCITD